MPAETEGIQCTYIEDLDEVWARPSTLIETTMHYCPGCGHSVVHRLIMETIRELGVQHKAIGVAPVGCAVFAYHYMDIDMQEAAHGRATAVATGIKRMLPDRVVFTYQGDGDLAAIGTAESLHTINRGENIVMIFINNGIYGMTGGQMAPTTLEGSITSTTPSGRELDMHGHPLNFTEMVAALPGAYYITRQAVNTAKAVRKAKRALMNAFTYQLEGKGGTSLIEFVSNCPSGWKMTPIESNQWLDNHIFNYYKLGDIKTPPKE